MLDRPRSAMEGGVSKPEAIGRIGGDASRIAEARRAAGSFHAYLELHLEQAAHPIAPALRSAWPKAS